MKTEFLDELYRYKVKAEQELESIENESNNPIPTDTADLICQSIDLRRKNVQSLVNRYDILIKKYLAIHN